MGKLELIEQIKILSNKDKDYKARVLKESLVSLSEESNFVMDTIANAVNAKTTFQRVVNNSILGGVYKRDYYIVPFKNQIAEIKTARFLISLAYKFSIREIKNIRYNIIFKGDKLELLDKYKLIPNLSVDRTDFELVEGGVAEVEYVNGAIDNVIMSKNEFVKLRDVSPSKDNGPWKTWPIQMCENKLIKNLNKKISLDGIEMAKVGYQNVEDEVALKSTTDGIVVVDQQTTNEVYEPVDHKKEIKKIVKESPAAQQFLVNSNINSVDDITEEECERLHKLLEEM